jgi:toxin-antitoxin system PIN domain toxin
MKSLLDTNVLIALLWPAHPFHRPALEWFNKDGRHGWATCPITQNGFVRIVSQVSFSPDALSVSNALIALERNLDHPAHEFWPDELSVPQCLALLEKPLQGHRQLTDAYLLGLAIHKQAHFVSFDKKISSLLSDSQRKSGLIVHLSVNLQ